MFFVVVGTHSKCVINAFTLTRRIDILLFQCHTVTNGTDLRRSPHKFLHKKNLKVTVENKFKANYLFLNLQFLRF